MMKRKDMTRDQLAAEATATALPGRSRMNRQTLEQRLTMQEHETRIARFGTYEALTPKQARRIRQKMNRQR